MNGLSDFVLGFFQVNGALVEPPWYGAHEVLLPDTLAEQLGVPALQEIVFDDVEPDVEDGRLHLSPGHPLVDRLVEQARQSPAPTRAYINSVRPSKQGLAEAARQALSFANARLVELDKQLERPALFHYLVLTFKVTLTTDEKQEHLVTVAMDAQAGWPVAWEAIRAQAALDEEPAFDHLEAAQPCWLDAPHPLTSEALAGLLQRAKSAALAELAGIIEALTRRSARYLELDRARLEQYYDDMVRDLERRRCRAEGEREATLQAKIAAAQAERENKLADAEALYRLRVDLQLVTAQVVVQPKVELLVQIENRNTQVQRRVVWDPLLHTVEPLACDVCGRPGLSLQLCSGGHLAHAECLLEQQCCDCKRVYCRLCGEQMQTCAVCGRPVCRASLNRCGICKRGTCREHVGLCHAANGAPATVQPVAQPAAPVQTKRKAAPAKTGASGAAGKPRPRPDKPAERQVAPRPKAPARPNTANWKLEVEVEWGEPCVTAYVRAGRKRTLAARTWRLTPRGISVICECDKPGCPQDHILLRPDVVGAIEAQMENEIQRLRKEYGMAPRAVSYTLYMHGMPSSEPRLILRGDWKNAELLAAARSGFDAEYARQYGAPSQPCHERPAPGKTPSRPLEPHEAAEAERFLKVAFGLLKREGTLKQDELYERVAALVHPGDWCSPKLVSALLRRNTQQFKVLASGLVATHDVSNVQALAVRKRAHRWLPQHPWTAEELLAIAERRETFSERETAIGNELSCLTGLEISVRALQSELQQGTSVAVVVSSLERHYGVSDPQALQRAKELLAELRRYTPLWELGGWTPADVSAKGRPPWPE